MLRALLIAMPLLGIASLAQGQIPCRYELAATIQGPNCLFGPVGLTPTAISPNGMYVTGWYGQCDIGDEAFIWIGPPPGTRVKIPRPPGTESAKGFDVNDNAVVTGLCWQSNKMRGFVYKYQSGQWINLLPPQPNGEVQPSAINNANTVVGYRSIRNDVVPREAFIWNESTGFQGLGVMIGPSSGAKDISENGIVVGWTGSNNGHPFYNGARAFIFQDGISRVLGPVPDGISSVAESVNANGQVLIHGKIQSSPLLYASHVYNAGAMTQILPPTGFDAVGLHQVTDTELLVGAYGQSSANDSHACLWQGSQTLVLQGHVWPAVIDFTRPNIAISASQNGHVLIDGRTMQNLQVGFILWPVPLFIGDSNCDQHVNVDDLLDVIGTWGPCQSCSTDFDQNGLVNIDDLLTVILNWLP